MNPTLNIEPNIPFPDDFYEALIEAHRDLSQAQSEMLNAKLILLLANHIGDLNVLRQALHIAKNEATSEAKSEAGRETKDDV